MLRPAQVERALRAQQNSGCQYSEGREGFAQSLCASSSRDKSINQVQDVARTCLNPGAGAGVRRKREPRLWKVNPTKSDVSLTKKKKKREFPRGTNSDHGGRLKGAIEEEGCARLHSSAPARRRRRARSPWRPWLPATRRPPPSGLQGCSGCSPCARLLPPSRRQTRLQDSTSRRGRGRISWAHAHRGQGCLGAASQPDTVYL